MNRNSSTTTTSNTSNNKNIKANKKNKNGTQQDQQISKQTASIELTQNGKQIKQTKKINIGDAIKSWLPIIIWMYVIYLLSNQTATVSSNLSSGITKQLVSILNQLFAVELDIAFIHFLIRKTAHFVAYFILGLLTYRAVKRTIQSNHLPAKKFTTASIHTSVNAPSNTLTNTLLSSSNKRFASTLLIALPLLICVLYAISDEIHQLYIPGRAGAVYDVILDSTGSLTAIMVMHYDAMRRYRSTSKQKIFKI